MDLDVFEDTDWGSSSVFSYYEKPTAADFLVSSVLETSLDREKKCKKSGEIKENKKQKLEKAVKESESLGGFSSVFTETVDADSSHDVISEKGKDPSDHADSSPGKYKKKKKKKISQKEQNVDNSNSAAVKKVANTTESEALTVGPKKKKRKDVNKRNKYKQLNIEQNKHKNITLVTGAEILKDTEGNVPPATDGTVSKWICNGNIICDGKREGGQDGNTIYRKSLKKKPCKDASQKLQKVEKTAKNKKIENKQSSTCLSPERLEETGGAVKTQLEVEKVDLNNPKCVDGVTENSEIRTKVDGKRKRKVTEINVALSKLNDENGDSIKEKDFKTSNDKVMVSPDVGKGDKKQKKKTPKIKENGGLVGDQMSKNIFIEAEDVGIQKDLNSFLKQLNFDQLKKGISAVVPLSSDDEKDFSESITDDECDEYVEDEMPKERGNCVKSQVAMKTKKQDMPVKSHERNGDLSRSERKTDEKVESVTNQVVSPTKRKKLDKNILNALLLEAEQNKTNRLPVEPATQASAPSAVEALKKKMTNQLNAACFRLVNEQMYTTTSSEAVQMFKSDPSSFSVYHTGFQSQVARWPVNPLDMIIKWLKKKPKHLVVADFGCGEATLAKCIPQSTVHSFDLVALNPRVTVSDMAHTPLKSNSVDVVVFCLSLMGTNIKDFIMEAKRVLKDGGIMKIAEVESRFTNVNVFLNSIKNYGFQNTFSNTTMKFFYLFDFKKQRSFDKNKNFPDIILKPCMYKRR